MTEHSHKNVFGTEMLLEQIMPYLCSRKQHSIATNNKTKQ